VSDSKPPVDQTRAAEDDGGVDVDDLEAALADEPDEAPDPSLEPPPSPDEAEAEDEAKDEDAAAEAEELAAADDLDEVLGRLQSTSDEPVSLPRRRARSPLVSLFVLAFATYLLVAMWGDFRYWTQPAQPQDLGQAAQLVASGGLTPDLHDKYVVLEGTPDVKNAAVGATKSNLVGYLRITEGGGALFAAVPRGKDEASVSNFEGRYVGRIRRLSEDRAFPWLQQFYETEKVTVPVDVDTMSLKVGLSQRKSDGSVTVESERGSTTLDAEQEIRVVVASPEARVQLGRRSFKTPQAARAAMASLGIPFAELSPTATFHRFVLRAPRDQLNALQAKIVADLPEAERTPGADPKVGALVLPKTSTYTAILGDVAVDADALVFPYEGNTTSPGYDVVDGRLVERTLADGMMRVPLAQVGAVRIEKRIAVDPNGFLISAGETPDSERLTGILWLVVLGIALANLVSVWVWWRRRAAA
jgi:hypothetical protein